MGELLYKCRKPIGKKHPKWSYNAVIYELNVRQFSKEGTFKAVSLQLQRLKGLGINIIWFMPIFPIGIERRKGSLGSYYSIRDYRAVNPEFGTIEDFRELLQMIHALGMKVILDWVPNHTSRDAVWVESNPEWYEKDPVTGEIATPFDWTDTAKLDYKSREMRNAMVEAMKFWLRDIGIDGFRIDMAMLVPIEFWNTTVPELEKVSPELFMLAEAEGVEFHDRAFDASYSWEIHHMMKEIAHSNANADTLRAKLTKEALSYPTEAFRMMFTSNHDENSWNGSEFERLGEAAVQMAALSFILPGIPLIYNGQEVASKKSLSFFEKDHIDWSERNDFTAIYEELCNLRHWHSALYSGEKGGDLYTIDNNQPWRVFSVKRSSQEHTVIALFNFSNTHADVEFYDEAFSGVYKQIGSPYPATLSQGDSFRLNPWGWFIYYR